MREADSPGEMHPEGFGYRYIIGMDLGTTNSAVCYVDLHEPPEGPGRRQIRWFEVPQLVSAGEVGRRAVLPSFLYLPGAYDLPAGGAALPWDAKREYVVGEFARGQGARVPGRLVSSAKSWLCHAGVNRTARILPWGAQEGVPKVSPVEASARYLQHAREAWNAQMVDEEAGGRFEEQMVVLTVPASFDEAARELTLAAARMAGIPRVVLLEEPLAAFYAWLGANEATWQTMMRAGQVILVCDVGGGTTDFSIVGVREGERGLRFDRLAVGDHLMLGGDNMDLTLARHLEARLAGGPGKLDSGRWHQLVHECRKGKETLLGHPEGEAGVDVVVVGGGGRLIEGTLRGRLSREEVRDLILDGFFPEVERGASPGEGRRSGLTEWGLPYVQDPAITRHLAAFWRRFEPLLREATGRDRPYPDFVLFNGGALMPEAVRLRLQEVVRRWFLPEAEAGPVELDNPRPDLSVAIGAAYYGLVRSGEGVRVGSGSPRAYYVAVADGNPGAGTRAVCLVPRGVEEGFEVRLDAPEFQALTNQPVAFQVYSSSTRLGDAVGQVVDLPAGEVSLLPPVQTVLRFGRKEVRRKIPVRLAVRLTEVGTLELWCLSRETEHRWQLPFDVRQETSPDGALPAVGETVEQAVAERAQEGVRLTFQGDADTHPPEQLMNRLAEILEMQKEAWPTPLIRALTDTALKGFEGRKLSALHEARWLNLLGFCLRPGFGDPVDDWRMRQVWKLYLQGLCFGNQPRCRSEWWVFWRRVAGGLTAGKQLQLYQQALPYLQGLKTKGKRRRAGRRINPQEELEVWMALGNFERLVPEIKTELGRLLLRKFKTSRPVAQELWALSCLGARSAVYGHVDQVVPGPEVSGWLDALFSLDLEASGSVGHALVHLARATGDRERDVSEADRERVWEWLGRLSDGERLRELLMNPESAFRREEQDWMFGESLPPGLVILQETQTRPVEGFVEIDVKNGDRR